MHRPRYTWTCVLPLLALTACADTNWERAFYQSRPENQRYCALHSRPTDPPCVDLPTYEAYEKQRKALLRADKAPVPLTEAEEARQQP
jgi:hypothetical protein